MYCLVYKLTYILQYIAELFLLMIYHTSMSSIADIFAFTVYTIY